MRIESELERDALEYVINLAAAVCDNRGCNDLEPEERKRFKDMRVERDDVDGTKFDDDATYDFDIVNYVRGKLNGKGNTDDT